jgi:hypothetical protein
MPSCTPFTVPNRPLSRRKIEYRSAAIINAAHPERGSRCQSADLANETEQHETAAHGPLLETPKHPVHPLRHANHWATIFAPSANSKKRLSAGRKRPCARSIPTTTSGTLSFGEKNFFARNTWPTKPSKCDFVRSSWKRRDLGRASHQVRRLARRASVFRRQAAAVSVRSFRLIPPFPRSR